MAKFPSIAPTLGEGSNPLAYLLLFKVRGNTMASRWMAPKLAKLKEERSEAMAVRRDMRHASLSEYLGEQNAKHELIALAQAYDGPTVKCPAMHATGLSRDVGIEGKRRRRLDKRTYGNGARQYHNWRLNVPWSHAE